MSDPTLNESDFDESDFSPPSLLSGDDGELFEEAKAWVKARNPFKADTFLNQIQECLQKEPDYLLLKCEIYKQTKKWDLLYETAEALVGVVPDDLQAWLYLSRAVVKRRFGNPAEEIRLLQAGIRQLPHELSLQYAAACCACELGDFDRARDLIFQAIHAHPPFRRMALRNPKLKKTLERTKARITLGGAVRQNSLKRPCSSRGIYLVDGR